VRPGFHGRELRVRRSDCSDTACPLLSKGTSWTFEIHVSDDELLEIPVGVTVFPDELYPAPRSWAEEAYPELVHFNEVDEGGHFAAWEQPETLSEQLRATFRSLR
jgi:hypothetical protein